MSPPVADSTKNVETKCSQRKINKPLIEKRRRARINDCLAQLKTIVLEANHSKSPRPSKLEKADILEMTVEFVKNKLTTNGSKFSNTLTEDDHLDYVAGYSKCLAEISHFLEETKPSNHSLKQDIVEHVSDKLKYYLIKDSKEETPVRKLPIPPLCKKAKESKIVPEEAIDLSVSMNNNLERTNDGQSGVTNDSIPKKLTNQNTEPSNNSNINQSAPFGLLCGGQVMLLLQLPQSVTSQIQVQNFQNINQSQCSIPMVGVQPMSVTSQPSIINQTVCRSEQTLICPTPLTFAQATVTNNQIQNHQSSSTDYQTIQNDSKGKHENHWRPW